jgi:hypothetical protein
MPSESPRESAYSTYHGEEVTPLPTYRTPIPDNIAPQYLPYRGTEQHGVPFGSEMAPLVEDVEGGKVATGDFYAPPTEDVAPVPVRIVEEAAHEFSQWRAYQTYVTTTVSRVVPRKEKRQNVTIRNVSTATTDRIWIGHDNGVTALSGYPLDAGADQSLTGEGEIWAVADSGAVSPVRLSVLLEFSTAQG